MHWQSTSTTVARPVAPTSGGNYKNTMHEWKMGTKVSDSYHNKFGHVHGIGLGYFYPTF